MKKLMVLAAVFSIGFAVNAASVDWTYYCGPDDNGLTVYVLTGDSSSASFADSAELIAAAVGSGVIQEDWDPDYFAGGSATSDAITKDSANIFYAIVSADGKQYKLTDSIDVHTYVYDPTAQESAPSTFSGLSEGSFGAFKDFAPVPEPTSGLLMLLGMAGLALKRKRA